MFLLLAGKIEESTSKILASCALEAAKLLANEEGGDDLERLRIKRLQIDNGKMKNSRLVHGLVLAKTRLDKSTPSFSKNGKIAIVDGELENKKIGLEASIEISDIGALESFHNKRCGENSTDSRPFFFIRCQYTYCSRWSY